MEIDVDRLPTIALVTPTYNHAHVLEETIKSVLDLGYPKLQYVVADGGSTDGTREILDRYRDRLHAVIEEPDRGPHDALNKGFALTTGTIMGWLNSDDTLLPGSLLLVGSLFSDFPDVRWLTGMHSAIDELGRPVVVVRPFRWSRQQLLSRRAKRWISQTSTFWTRDLWDEAGGSAGDIWGGERTFPHAFDFELWARFSRYAQLQAVAAPIGRHRHLAGQEGRVNLAGYEHYAQLVRDRERARTVFGRAAGLFADVSCLFGALRLDTAEAAVAGVLGAPPVIVFDERTHTFRRRERLELTRRLTRRSLGLGSPEVS